MPNSIGTPAASSIDSPAGIAYAEPAGTDANSAWLPWPIVATTGWPTLKPSTPDPTSLTVPAAW